MAKPTPTNEEEWWAQKMDYRIERKQVGLYLPAFKGLASSDSGGFSGYITKWNVLDEVGDIILKGGIMLQARATRLRSERTIRAPISK